LKQANQLNIQAVSTWTLIVRVAQARLEFPCEELTIRRPEIGWNARFAKRGWPNINQTVEPIVDHSMAPQSFADVVGWPHGNEYAPSMTSDWPVI
jgi:hypothetical protein